MGWSWKCLTPEYHNMECKILTYVPNRILLYYVKSPCRLHPSPEMYSFISLQWMWMGGPPVETGRPLIQLNRWQISPWHRTCSHSVSELKYYEIEREEKKKTSCLVICRHTFLTQFLKSWCFLITQIIIKKLSVLLIILIIFFFINFNLFVVLSNKKWNSIIFNVAFSSFDLFLPEFYIWACKSL